MTHPATLNSMNGLAASLSGLEQNGEAEELRRKTIKIQQRVLGEEHPSTLVTMHNLSLSLQAQERYAEAEDLKRRVLNLQRRTLGPHHPSTISTTESLRGLLFDVGERQVRSE